MSALHPKADIHRCDYDVRFVPKADIQRFALRGRLYRLYHLLNCLHCLCQFLVQSASLVVAELVWLENHGKFRERAGEREWHLGLVLLQHWSSRVLSHVEGFIEREANPDGPWDTTLRDLLFIDQQRCGCSLADAAAVIVEFDPDDMIARGERLIGGNAELVIRLV